MEQQQSLSEFVAKYGLAMTVEAAESNPNMAGDMPAGSRHYLCKIKRRDDDGELIVPFSCGPGLTGEPVIQDVLSCLASDGASLEHSPDWIEWAGDLGLFREGDADEVRKAQATFAAVEQQSEALREMLGREAYAELLYETEPE